MMWGPLLIGIGLCLWALGTGLTEGMKSAPNQKVGRHSCLVFAAGIVITVCTLTHWLLS